MFQSLRDRSVGRKRSPVAFQHAAASSPDLVERLELRTQLEGHNGCVNTVCFSDDGELLVSGSDDQRVMLWNWYSGTRVLSYVSGHHNNIFQARPLPHTNNSTIVTCAADGQVRVGFISPEGGSVTTHLLAHHGSRAHKLALNPEAPTCFYSCGEDGRVFHYDVRSPRARQSLLVCNSDSSAGRRERLQLHSIHCNPLRPWQFVVGGSDIFVRVYDQRRSLSAVSPAWAESSPSASLAEPVRKLAPKRLQRIARRNNRGEMAWHVTCASFSRQGEIVATYNDENVYLFQSEGPMPAAPRRRASSDERPTLRKRLKRSNSPRLQTKFLSSFSQPPGWPAHLFAQGDEEDEVDSEELEGRARSEPQPELQNRQADAESPASPAAAAPLSHQADQNCTHASSEEVLRRSSLARSEGKGSWRALHESGLRDESSPLLGQSLETQPSARAARRTDCTAADESAGDPAAGREREGTQEAASEAQHSAPAHKPSASEEEEEEEDNNEGGADSLSEGWCDAAVHEKDELSSDESDGESVDESDDESGPMSFTAADGEESESESDNGVFVETESNSEDEEEASRDEGGLDEPGDEVLMVFSGHRNCRTVKGISFLGDSDEYVMSGSDDGHIYIWSKADGILRQWLLGDLDVVNCLEPHPTHPMSFATSGIDDTIKLWTPTAPEWHPVSREAEAVMARNRRSQGPHRGRPSSSARRILMRLQHIAQSRAAGEHPPSLREEELEAALQGGCTIS